MALLLAISLNSAQAYRCVTAEEKDCQCIFPFKVDGESYETCADPTNDGNNWCATALKSDGEYSEWGWCLEDLPPVDQAETMTETKTGDVCAGQCEKANQKCEEVSGKAVCKCLEGYFDEKNDGNSCKCVRDWTSAGTFGTRGDLCTSCPRGFELKQKKNNESRIEKQWCRREAEECNPVRVELNQKYPNIRRIGQGYNIIVGNLLALPALDSAGHNGFRGLHKRIFNPYSIDIADSGDACNINGYNFDGSKNCQASLKTTVFSNSNQVLEKIEDKVKTGEMVEEFKFSVSEGENAQFSNSVSFGASFSLNSDSTKGSSANHCVDESTSQQTDIGKTVDYTKTAENSKSSEKSQSSSDSYENTSSDTQTQSNTRERSSSSTSETSVEATAGVSFFGATASVTAGSSSSNTDSTSYSQSTENSRTNSFTQGYTSENGFSRSQSSSDSTTNSDSFTNTASNQKSISTNICGEDSQSNTITKGEEKSEEKSTQNNSGSTFEKSFEIPGDSRSVIHSKAVAETEDFFQESSGSISHTEASCVKFSARLNDNSPPAFTKDFKDIVREMDSLTEELWYSNIETKKLYNGKLISRKNEKNEEEFDRLFEKFVENFGTHYIQEAKMGGIQRLSSQIKSLKEDTGNIEQVENCLTKAIKEKRGDQSVQDGRSNDNCNDEDIENRVKAALETTEVQVHTFGAGANEDIYQWTSNDFLSPTLLPDFKLQPIVKLFQSKFMKRERVTRNDGTAINHKRILSWLTPRYAILIGRCKLMKNHHVEDGKTCRANKEFLVSNRDGTEEIHLAALCESLPNHILPRNATDCTWCPGGVDKAARQCKVNKL
jgi:hypothetical protein